MPVHAKRRKKKRYDRDKEWIKPKKEGKETMFGRKT